MPTTRATTDEDDWRLRIAEYVVLNTPVWTEPEQKPKPGESADFTAKQVIGGNIIVGETTQTISTGKTYAYPTMGVQGLSAMSSSPGIPSLYAVMGPDQYLVNPPFKLNEEQINSLSEVIKTKFGYTLTNKHIRNVLTGLQFRNGETFATAFMEALSKIEGIDRSEIRGIINDDACKNIIQHYHNQAAQQHTKDISANIGSPYIAISLVGKHGSEINGFNLPDTQVTYQSDIKILHNGQQGDSALKIYDNPESGTPISRHVVIGSGAETNATLLEDTLRDETKSREEKLTLGGDAIDKLLETYEMAKKENKPIVVNCTDGIDRTGIILFSLAILKHADQNPAFLKATHQEQQKQILKIYNDLKENRGYAFLRLEHDIARGVTLGYTLIAANRLKNPKAANDSPNVLSNLEKERQDAEQQFRIANHEHSNFSKYLKNLEGKRMPTPPFTLLEKASPEQLQSLRENNIDINAFKKKSNPVIESFKAAATWVQVKVSSYLAERRAWHEDRKKMLNDLWNILDGIENLKKKPINCGDKLNNYAKELIEIDKQNKLRSFNVMAYTEKAKDEINKLFKQLAKEGKAQSNEKKDSRSTVLKSPPTLLYTNQKPTTPPGGNSGQLEVKKVPTDKQPSGGSKKPSP
ncbi:MAG: protein-tyrosine phosphatase family protein [Gammaproteobacteria bacterium]